MRDQAKDQIRGKKKVSNSQANCPEKFGEVC